jgi:hypothetical protein
MKIVLFEDLAERTQETVSEILAWLGLDPRVASIDFSRRSNQASVPKISWLQRESVSPSPIVKKIYRTLIPVQKWRHYLRERLVTEIIEKNLTPFQYPPLSAKTRKDLHAFFAPGNRQLAALLDRDLDHWV